MTNKKELELQAEKLQFELNKLKDQISKSEDFDIFSITSYKEVCKYLKEKETNCPYQQIKQLERCFNQD